MKKYLTLAGIVLALSVHAMGQTASDHPTITVSGQAEVMVAPDEVVFKLRTENVNSDLNKAKAKTDENVKKIFMLARNYRIEPQNVQTNYIRINEHYTQGTQNKPREFDGYEVTQTTTILLKDVSRFESLLSDLVKEGISDVSDVTFRASQMRKYMDQARALAMRAAREKALALAGEISQRIGKANNITEVGMTVSSAYEEDSDHSNSNYSNTSSTEIAHSVPDNQGTIAPGMISITARVKVSFELN
jgi:uncharacterized protein YggE